MNKFLSALLLLGLFPFAGTAQKGLKEAHLQLDFYNYAVAAPLYAKAYDGSSNGKATLEAARGAAECYRKMLDYGATEFWYAKVVATPGSTNEEMLHYAEALMNNSKYEDAQDWLKSHGESLGSENEPKITRMLESCDSALTWISNPIEAKWGNAKTLNSEGSDCGVTMFKDKVLFVSDRITDDQVAAPSGTFNYWLEMLKDKLGVTHSVAGTSGRAYFKLFGKGEEGSAPVVWNKGMKGKGNHMGSIYFSRDGKEVFFTRTRPINVENSYGGERPANMALYSAKLDDSGNWMRPVSFSYNNTLRYSIGDPCLAPDGNTLYFVSNKPNGFGGTDIYYCTRTHGGKKWSEPVSMGDQINTAGLERSPYVDEDGNLYFASTGRIGMGGLDIYKATKDADGRWNVENMGYPVNSPQDDFAPCFLDKNNMYVSSNRLGGNGNDDIYLLTLNNAAVAATPGISIDYTMGKDSISAVFASVKAQRRAVKDRLAIKRVYKGVIKDEKGLPIENAMVVLKDLGKQTQTVVITSANGEFTFPTETDAEYSVVFEKTGFIAKKATVILRRDMQTSDLALNMKVARLEINKPQTMENIYYDLNEWKLRADALPELDNLVKMMQDNPTFTVEISSHTDSRGDEKRNVKLSQKRAEAAVAYLLRKGIPKANLKAKGYGSSQLLNQCTKEVACSEEEHQLNRRTEFSIIDN